MRRGTVTVDKKPLAPPSFALLSPLRVASSITAADLMEKCEKRSQGEQEEVFDETWSSPSPPPLPSLTPSALHPPVSIFELRVQKQQPTSLNLDEHGQCTWKLKSLESKASAAAYYKYWNKEKEAEDKEDCVPPKRRRGVKMIKFAAGSDISDKDLYKNRFAEVVKFPSSFRVNSTETDDILTILPYHISGITGNYYYYKLRGVRTPVHEEDGGIPSVNVAVGPGDSEWYCVSREYAHAVEEKQLDWGLAELEHRGVPVIRFTQRKGEMVYTAPGTLHWVKGLGAGANVAWGRGPLSASLLQAAMDQAERSRLQRLHCSIGLQTLAWCIAEQSIAIDSETRAVTRDILVRSLAYLKCVELWAAQSGELITDRPEREPYVCEQCKVEVFNTCFTTMSVDDEVISHCTDCMQKDGGFETHSAIRQRSIDKLCTIYDQFNI